MDANVSRKVEKGQIYIPEVKSPVKLFIVGDIEGFTQDWVAFVYNDSCIEEFENFIVEACETIPFNRA